jgi:hypothetical protein
VGRHMLDVLYYCIRCRHGGTCTRRTSSGPRSTCDIAVEVVDAPWEAVDEEDESLAVLVVLAAACTRCCCGALERVLASDAACGVLAALIICSNIVMSGCASEGLAVPTGLACQ